MKKRLALFALPPLALAAVATVVAAKPPSRAKKTAPATAASKKTAAAALPAGEAVRKSFLAANCVGCHDGQTKSGGLDLTALKWDLNDPNTFAEWVKVHDRLQKGEMPPKGMDRPPAADQAAFLKAITAPMLAADQACERTEGRAVWRRMNRYEYENTIRDLFDAPYLQLKDKLPEDGEANRFNKVGTALDVSHVQMNQYLNVADFALRAVAAQQLARMPAETDRYYARQQGWFKAVGKKAFLNNEAAEREFFPLVGDTGSQIADVPALLGEAPVTAGAKNPEKRDQEALGMVASAYEPIEPTFRKFHAPVSGRYRLRLCAHSFWAGPMNAKAWYRPSRLNCAEGRTREPISLYAQAPPRQLRKIGTVEVGPKSTVVTLDTYLLKGETVRPDAVRLFRSRPPAWHNPLATPDGQPGVAFQWLEVEGPFDDAQPGKGYRLLFGDVPVQTDDKGDWRMVPRDPDADSARLIRNFVTAAYRRPATAEDAAPFIKLAHSVRTVGGASFTDSMIAAYSAVLCSPEFLTLREKPGPLDGDALAERLSYFLWNAPPDAALRSLGDSGALRNPAVLNQQVDRMLDDPRSQQFVNAFTDYWLDLRKTNNNSPDAALYPDYYLDDYLVESSIDETHAFFATLVHDNLPAKDIVDSNFVTINERLADLYGIKGVEGPQIRKVELPADSVRGGLLTQASILKVTANGTTTSPVLRGVWITERILGQPVPPPPPSLPAIEPDIRGATTVRQQLEKHRTQATCRACHANLDPPGFALENFDVCGGWRDHYRAVGDADGKPLPGRGHDGQPFDFHWGPPVDATGALPDGRAFKDVRDLKRLLISDQRQLARNLLRQFVVYGTGAPARFGDRPAIEGILDKTAKDDYGVRSLIHGLVESPIFTNK